MGARRLDPHHPQPGRPSGANVRGDSADVSSPAPGGRSCTSVNRGHPSRSGGAPSHLPGICAPTPSATCPAEADNSRIPHRLSAGVPATGCDAIPDFRQGLPLCRLQLHRGCFPDEQGHNATGHREDCRHRRTVNDRSPQPTIDELLDRAVAAINRGDRSTADALAGRVLAVDRSNPDAEELLAAPADSGEIRRLTMLFADLVDSTALSMRIEPEVYRTVVGRYRDEVHEDRQPIRGPHRFNKGRRPARGLRPSDCS